MHSSAAVRYRIYGLHLTVVSARPLVSQFNWYGTVDLDLRLFVTLGVFRQQGVLSYKSYKGACPFSGLMRMGGMSAFAGCGH
jgi:hypothetical protein